MQKNQIHVTDRKNAGVAAFWVEVMDRRQAFFRCRRNRYAHPFRRLRMLDPIALLCMTFVIPTVILVQNQAIRISGPNDSNIGLPSATGVLGRTDLAANQETQASLKVTCVLNCGSYRGTGVIQYDSTDQPQLSASLTVQQGKDNRLDVTTPKGRRSTRFFGESGVLPRARSSSSTQIPVLIASCRCACSRRAFWLYPMTHNT